MTLDEMKNFFEANPLSIKAASSIKNGRKIHLIVTKADGNQNYCFAKEGKKNVLTEETPTEPDVTFTMPEATAKEIVDTEFESVGQVGLFIFKKLMAQDPNEKVHVKLNCGILSFMTGGYLGVLKSGGAEVAKFLASKGLSSPGKIKELLSRLKKA